MYLRVSQVAEELQCSPITVYRLIASGRLAAVRLGRDLRVSREALAALAVGFESASGAVTPGAKRKGPDGCNRQGQNVAGFPDCAFPGRR